MKKLFLLFIFLLTLFVNTIYVYGDDFREAMDTFAHNVSNAAIKSLDILIRYRVETSDYKIRFLVDKDGNFSDFKIITSTKNKEIDEYIVNAIKSQAHKYPLPAQMANLNENVEIIVEGNHKFQIFFIIVCLILLGPVSISLFIQIASFGNFKECIVNYFSPFVASLKRNFYVKTNSFVSKNKNSYTLFNDNIIFIYNYKERSFICNEIKTKRNFTVEEYTFPIKKTFDDFFDDVLYSFNKKTDYYDVFKKLNTGFLNIVCSDPKKENREITKEREIPVINVNPKIDVKPEKENNFEGRILDI